jgi:AbrB family looped-hinge helix DNA binding protein
MQNSPTSTREVDIMKERWTVVTRKGQVTVPAEIRQELGLREGDKVAFVLDEGEVRLLRATSVVQRTAGALRSDKPPLTAEELREAAERAIAQEAVERMES